VVGIATAARTHFKDMVEEIVVQLTALDEAELKPERTRGISVIWELEQTHNGE